MEIIALPDLVRFLAAFIFVIALMTALGVTMRYINERRITSPANKKRLGIVEVLQVDGKRRLVLLRRDGTEHLVMLGANGETVIESGIESPQNKAVTKTSAPKRRKKA